MEINKKIAKRANRILDCAREIAEKFPGYSVSNYIEEIQLHFNGFSEPGYDNPECGIIATGNWNNISKYDRERRSREIKSDLPSRILRLFEKLGIDCCWSDEWANCENCQKLFRTSPDSHGWMPSYALVGDEYHCVECLKENAEEHLEALEGDAHRCNTIGSIDPSEYGYVKVNEDSYESGLHEGQNDNPKVIAKDLRAKGIERFLFNMDDVGQFDQSWSVYVHTDEVHLLETNENPDPNCIHYEP